jgi:hypothetical protein
MAMVGKNGSGLGRSRRMMFVGALFLVGCEASATREARNIAELEAGVSRSVQCFVVQEALTKASAAGPYEVVTQDSMCKVVAKNLAAGAELPSGLETPSSYGDGCSKLEAKWKEAYAAWEAEQKLTVALDCDKEGKPTQKLHDHAKLAALDDVLDHMGATLPHDPSDPEFSDCIETVSAFKKKAVGEKQKLRCEILKTEGALPNMLGGRLFGRLRMEQSDIEGYADKHEAFKKSVAEAKPEDVAALLKRSQEEILSLLKAQQGKLCGKAADPTPGDEALILSQAVAMCTRLYASSGGAAK